MKQCKVIPVGTGRLSFDESSQRLQDEINRYEAHGYQIKAVVPADSNCMWYYIFLEKDVKPQP